LRVFKSCAQPPTVGVVDKETRNKYKKHNLMKIRIFKDIRYYESDNPNIEGQRMPQDLGKLFYPTKDINYIGQRIARKLNELQYSFGEIDHIYINLTTVLQENQVQISNRNIDKRIKYIDFGANPIKFNSLTDDKKNEFVKFSTIEILRNISDENNLSFVNETAKQLSEFDTEIKIHYKTKETNLYRIDIYYQIKPKGSFTKAIVEYKNKTTNTCHCGFFELQFYDDIYPLVDTITLKGNKIVLNPKKSFRADIYNKRYKTPIALKIDEFEKRD
jgi:hypothetical protein